MLAVRLQADVRNMWIWVFFLTSSGDERQIAESYASGANSYLVKPVECDEFVRAVSSTGMYRLILNESPGPL